MKRWEDIFIDTFEFESIRAAVEKHKGDNPACTLRSCWTEKMNVGLEKTALGENRLGYGFVGDGFPVKKSQPFIPQIDLLNLRGAFPDLDYRDVGDAIHQANSLIPLILSDPKKRIYVIDFGAGYGRLALPFLFWARREVRPLTYIGVEYSPAGLMIAPQFVSQALDVRSMKWNTVERFEDYDYVSLPAWRIKELDSIKGNIFITIHSFQEMTDETIDFYLKTVNQTKAENALFYSVNYVTEFERFFETNQWKKIIDIPYPINRDGSYNEKLWSI